MSKEETIMTSKEMSKYIKLEDAIYGDCILIDEIKCEDCPFYNEERFICRMVEWLESLPTIEVSEDCISRGKLISDLADIWEDGYTPNLPRTMLDFQDMLEDINYKIRNAPSVVPTTDEKCSRNQDW